MNLVASDAGRSIPTLPGGTVVDQNPKAGQEVQPGSTVTIYVSNAPDVDHGQGAGGRGSGCTEPRPKAKLALYGLKAKVIHLETPDYPAGPVHPAETRRPE